MPSVPVMLSWKLPPTLIALVMLLRFLPDHKPDSLDFSELFSGAAELSKAMRRVAGLFTCYFSLSLLAFSFDLPSEAGFHGTSIDNAYDARTICIFVYLTACSPLRFCSRYLLCLSALHT